MNLEVLVTDKEDADFIYLIKLLDEDLHERYGELQKQYDKHNTVDFINDVVVIYKDNVPVACGAFKEYDSCSVEMKRIFVMKEHRQQGLAKMLMNKLEKIAASKNYKYAVLETGVKQQEAIGLYKKYGYEVIENYGVYAGDDNSVCMRKTL